MANIPTITAINSQTESLQPWLNQGGIKAVVQNTANPLWPINVLLDANTVTIQRPGVVVGIQLTALITVAVQYAPTLTSPPVITVQPVSLANQVPTASSSFSVTANSFFGLSQTYQWLVSTNGGASFSNATGGVYSGGTTATLSISSLNGLNNNIYKVVITNASGPTTSNLVAITTDPAITTQPSSISVAHPAAASFTVVAAGQSSITYQWQHSTDGGSTWNNLSNSGVFSNVTTATMNISDSTGLNATQYRCNATDRNGVVTSSAAIFTVT